MRKKYGGKIIATCAAVCAVLLLTLFVPKGEAYAAGNPVFSYSMNSYEISCAVDRNCSVEITETISFDYVNGKFSRTIKTSDGVRVKHAKLTLLEEDAEGNLTETKTGYRVSSDGNGVTVEAKNSSDGEEQAFRISYTLAGFARTKTNDNDYVEIPLVGSFPSGTVKNVSLELSLPAPLYSYNDDGTLGAMVSLMDSAGNPVEQYPDVEYSDETLTMSLALDTVPSGNYVRFRLFFDKGVLRSGTGDILPWLLLLIGAAVATAAITLRLTVFGKKKAHAAIGDAFVENTPGEDAPDETIPSARTLTELPIARTDPLTTRRILEEKIEDRDVVTLLMFWAEEGHIKINAKNEGNPVFVKGEKPLPADAPDSWKELYGAMFAKTDRSSLKSVAPAMRPAMNRIKKDANKKRETAFDKKSVLAATVLAAAVSLFVAAMPALTPMRMSVHAAEPLYLFSAVPAFIVFALLTYAYLGRWRSSRTASIAIATLAAVVAVACAVLYIVLIPDSVFAIGPKTLCALLYLASAAFAASCVKPSVKYAERLSEANAVKSFVSHTEKEDLLHASEKTGDIYWRYLPYARVMRSGVAWSEKFFDTSVSCPAWLETERPSDRFPAVHDTVKKTFDAIYRKIYGSER